MSLLAVLAYQKVNSEDLQKQLCETREKIISLKLIEQAIQATLDMRSSEDLQKIIKDYCKSKQQSPYGDWRDIYG